MSESDEGTKELLELMVAKLEAMERKVGAMERRDRARASARKAQATRRQRRKLSRLATGAKALQLQAREFPIQRALTPEEHALKCQELERKRQLRALKKVPKTEEQKLRDMEMREYVHAGPARRREIRQSRRARYLRAQGRKAHMEAIVTPSLPTLDEWSMERILPPSVGCAREQEGAQGALEGREE